MKRKIYFVFFVISFFFFTKTTYSQPSVTCTVLQQPCNNDGILVTNVSGMVPPLTFTYTGINTITHTNVTALTDTFVGNLAYYVQVFDANGLYSWQYTGMINPFTIDWPVITPVQCPATTGSILLTVNSGNTPDFVEWFDAFTGSFIGNGNPGILPEGLYNAFVYYNGCIAFKSDTGMYINNISPVTFSVNTTPASCANGTATVNNISGGIPPYSFHWSNGANTQSIGNLTSGTYGVTVTDAQGCYKTQNWINISQTPYISINSVITPATCLQNDGSISVFASGGVPPYTYAFSNGFNGQTVTDLTGGTTLNVMTTDANGCIGFKNNMIVGFSTPITVTYSATPSSCTAPTGSATLNISGGTSPYTVVWNTFPPQTGLGISSMHAGTYPFKVTDALGCVRTGNVQIPPESIINAQLSAVNAVCPNNTGSISAYVTGNNGPFTYIWSNGSTQSSLNNAATGSYTCTITDALGCSVIKSAFIGTSSTIGLGFNTTPASCLYTSDGSIIANAFGGTPPYTYNWSNGMTGASITGLAKGKYYVYVSDANGCTYTGCQNSSYVGYDATNDSCYCTIQGKVYVDLNSNCLYDTGEQGVKNIMIHCAGFGYAFTNANGDYQFKVPTGNYTLSEVVQHIYPLASCQNNAVPVNVVANTGCFVNVDFANIINPLNDIKTTALNVGAPPIPGFTYTHGLMIKNNGTITESDIQIGYKHDGQLQYVSTLPNLFTQQQAVQEPDWYSINTGFPVLDPGASSLLLINYDVPVNIPLGTHIFIRDTAASSLPMSNWLNDYTPWDNLNYFQAIVVGSYDPNYKEVYPKGEGPEGYISTNDSILDYVIHFQNMGTYYAQNIVITDTLDPDLDWTSLSPDYATHDYVATLDETGVLKFTFHNINLTWQSYCEYLSRGLVSFSIKQKPNLNGGTEIRNTANIYFDFNPPVITNTTLNTIAGTVPVNITKTNKDVIIYPNPASDFLNIQCEKIEQIKVYDISGRLLMYEKSSGQPIHVLSVGHLSRGMYIIEIFLNNGERTHLKMLKN